MGKLEGSVSPGCFESDLLESMTVTTTRLAPPGNPSTLTYSGQLTGSHNRSLLIESAMHIHPLPYRVFAGRFIPNQFAYTYMAGSSLFKREGSTPVSASVGAAIPITWGTAISGGVRVPDVSQNMKNQAITECLNKLQDSKGNLLVSIAEARDGYNTIVNIFSTIVRSLRLAIKGKLSQAYRVLTGVRLRGRDTRGSRFWLQYQYALRPMFGEIQGAFEWMNQGLKDKPIIAARRYVSSPYGLPKKPFHFKVWGVTGKCDVGVEVSLRAKLTNPTINLLGQMGLYNPFALAWELVPLSFVIDWLIPIGNALEALTAPLGLTFHDGYINTKTVTDFHWYGVNVDGAIGTLPGGNVKNVCQKRDTYVNFPLSRLYIKSPFSSSNLISALALFAVLRKQ